MSPGWTETYLGLIFQVYGLAFFVLGVAALLSMRRDSGTGLTADLGWLAAFGMLHGLQEFIDGERLHNPAAWLVVLGTALMVASFAALLEFGRRVWNERPRGRRLAAVPLYATAGVGTVALLMAAPAAGTGLELGARYLLGAPGAALAGIGLFAYTRATAHSPDTVGITRWLRVAAFALFGYAALTLFLSSGYGHALAHGLPTTEDFLAATGLPVQLVRALCAVLLAVSFVIFGRHAAALTNTTLQRVTNGLDGFVYRCRNDRHWSVTFMSEGGEILTGYPAADFLRGERHFGDQIHPDDRQRVWAEVQAALAARREFRLQYRMLDRNGTVRWVYEEGCGIFDEQGELLHLEGLVRNDEARHQADVARGRMQALVEASPQAVGWADPDGRVRFFNVALRTLLAVPEGAEISGYRLRDFYDERTYERIESTVLPAVAALGAWVGEVELAALDGRRVPTLHSVFVLRDAAGGIAAFANVITDLTEVRAAQRHLRIKDAAIAGSTSAIALAGLDGSLTYVNQAFVELWGLAGPQEALGRSALSFWDEPGQAQAVLDTLARTGRWEGELPGRRADGSLVDVQLAGNLVLDDDGRPLCMMGSFLDVTARKRALLDLQRERDFAKSLLDTAPVIVLVLDPRGMIRYVNPHFEHLTGYRLDEVRGREWFATLLPERDREHIRALFLTAVHETPTRGNINPIVTSSGVEIDIEWYDQVLRDDKGNVTGVLAVGQDVTERLALQTLERDSRQRLQSILDSMFAFVGLFTSEGIVIEANRAPLAAGGLKRDDVIGKPFWETYWWAYSPQGQAQVRHALQRAAQGETVRDDFRVRLAENVFIIIDATFGPIRDESGQVTEIVGSGVDTTARRQAEVAVREIVAKLDEAQHIGQIGSWELDVATGELTWSAETFRIFEIDKQKFGATYEAFLNAIHPEDRDAVSAAYTDSLRTREPYEITHRLRMPDGRIKYVHERCKSEFDADDKPLRSVGTVQDITERWVTEERVRASLAEKETLLREIHHRVKNNLQIISSLLHFQSRKSKDPESLAVFQEGRDRLKSMILVHEKLYQSRDLSRIEFGDYARSLVAEVAASYRGRASQIALKVQTATVHLTIQVALPLGMLLSELVTNVHKYAYPEGRGGELRVTLVDAEGQLRLEVADDGVGLPEAVDPAAPESFGMQLVANLVQQLGGTVRYTSGAGLRVDVSVPLAGARGHDEERTA